MPRNFDSPIPQNKNTEKTPNWESVTKELSAPAAVRVEDHTRLKNSGTARDGESELFDRQGKKISDTDSLKNNAPLISVRTDEQGRQQIFQVYIDKNDFANNKALLTETFQQQQHGELSTEQRMITRDNGNTSALRKSLNQKTLALSFQIDSDGVQQQIDLDGNSKLQNFALNTADHKLTYKIEDGRVFGVDMVKGDGRINLSPTQQAKFIDAANSSVRTLREKNGMQLLPENASAEQDKNTLRALTSPEMFRTLLREAQYNKELQAVLSNLSNNNILSSDPLVDAIRAARQQHPESSDRLSNAAIKASEQNSKAPLENAIAREAASDNKFATTAREIIAQHLQSENRTNKTTAVDMLLAMSPQWDANDFKAALGNIQPDQIRSFKKALESAPPEVQMQAAVLASNDIDLKNRMRLIMTLDNENTLFNGGFNHPTKRSDLFNSTDGKLSLLSENNSRENASRKILEGPSFERPSKLQIPGENRSQTLDTRYLAETLDGAERKEPLTPAQMFERLGVKDASLAPQIAEATEKYGAQTIIDIGKRAQLFNALNPETRARLSGMNSGDRIDEGKLAGLLLNGELKKSEGEYSFLLGEPSVEQKLDSEIKNASDRLQEARQNLNASVEARQNSFRLLNEHNGYGVEAGALVSHGAEKLATMMLSGAIPLDGKIDLYENGVESFSKKQAYLLGEFRNSDDKLKNQARELQELSAAPAELKFAQAVYDYESLVQGGSPQLHKDAVALMMLEKFGMDAIKTGAPKIWADLNEEALHRLAEQNLIQRESYAEITGNRGERIETALDIATSLSENSEGNLDRGLRRRQAFDVFDGDPSLLKAQQQTLKFGEEFATFSTLFESGNKGTKYETLVKDLKEQAKDLQQLMNASAAEVGELVDMKLKLKSAVRQCSDTETVEGLKQRIDAIEGALDIIDPNSQKHKELAKILSDAQSRSFSADTLGTWLCDNGPTIAAAAAGVAISVATVGTGSPIAAVLISSAASLGATQLAKETMFQINHGWGDTGFGAYNDRSYAGAWYSKHSDDISKLAFSNSNKESSEAATKLIISYAKEVGAPISLEYTQNVVMGLVGLGVLRVGQQGLSGVNSQWVKSLAANPKGLDLIRSAGNSSTTRATLAKLMTTARGVAGESIEEIGEEGFSYVAEKALQQSDIPMASLLVSASIGLAKGKFGANTHAKLEGNNHLQIDSSMTDTVIKNFKESGHRVEKLADNSYEVSSYTSPNARLRITPGVHFADGVGGKLTNPDQPLRVNAAKKSVEAAKLADANLEKALIDYTERGPRGVDVVNKVLAIDDGTRKQMGINDAVLRGESPDTIAKLLLARNIAKNTSEQPIGTLGAFRKDDTVTFTLTDRNTNQPESFSGDYTVHQNQQGDFPEGIFLSLDADSKRRTAPAITPQESDLILIDDLAQPQYRDVDGNVWRKSNGELKFVDDSVVLRENAIHSITGKNNVTVRYQTIAQVRNDAKANEASIPVDGAEISKEQLLSTMASAPELSYSRKQLIDLNANCFGSIYNPNNGSKNCKESVASLFRSLNSGKLINAAELSQQRARDGNPVGEEPYREHSTFEEAQEVQAAWLRRAAGAEDDPADNSSFHPNKINSDFVKSSTNKDFAVVVQFPKQEDGGHVFYAHFNNDGSVLYYDPQSGVRWHPDSVESLGVNAKFFPLKSDKGRH